MTSPRRDLIKIAELSQQAWRSLAEMIRAGWALCCGRQGGCWAQGRSSVEPGLRWKVPEGQGGQKTGKGTAASMGCVSRGVSRAGSGGPLVLVPSTRDPQPSGRQLRAEVGEEYKSPALQPRWPWQPAALCWTPLTSPEEPQNPSAAGAPCANLAAPGRSGLG